MKLNFQHYTYSKLSVWKGQTSSTPILVWNLHSKTTWSYRKYMVFLNKLFTERGSWIILIKNFTSSGLGAGSAKSSYRSAKSSYRSAHCLAFIPTWGKNKEKKKKPESALPPLKIEKEAKMTLRQWTVLSLIKVTPGPAGLLQHGSGQYSLPETPSYSWTRYVWV